MTSLVLLIALKETSAVNLLPCTCLPVVPMILTIIIASVLKIMFTCFVSHTYFDAYLYALQVTSRVTYELCFAMEDYFIEYHPYNDGNNPNHYPGSDSQSLVYLKIGYESDNIEDLRQRIQEWLKGILDNKDIVIAIAPGHSPQSPPNFLHGIVRSLIHGNIKDGRDLLKRKIAVPMAAQGGPRDQDLHENTIEVTDPSKVKDKVVYIIDDIWTTGSTLRACASLIRRAGASDVKLFAVGKTVSMQHDD